MGCVTAGTDMAELLDIFFASVLTNKISQPSLFGKKGSRVRITNRK